MYTAVRFFPCAAIHSARSSAWPMVSSASTSTASRSPEISVADIGDQDRSFSPGARSPPGIGSGGGTYTSQLSDAEWSVIGTPRALEVALPTDRDDSVGGLGRRSHQRGPSPVPAR